MEFGGVFKAAWGHPQEPKKGQDYCTDSIHGGLYAVRHVCPKKGGTVSGQAGVTRVMSHDERMIRSEVYNFSLGWYRRSKL